MNNVTSTIVLAAAFLGGCAGVTKSTKPSVDAESAVSERTQAKSPHIVQGDLDITNQTSLESFENVEVVTGTLTIVGNTRLSSLHGLERLHAVKHLVIRENLSLTNVEGLSGLRHARSMTLEANPRLENLNGLEGLEKLDRLVVSKNGIYCTRGLSGLTEAGDVVIASNPRLLGLQGLRNLLSADSVTITNNPRLSAQSGLLEGLRRVTGRLEISGNAGLHTSEVNAVRDRFSRPDTVAAR
jgi:hypothetical protein